MAEQVSDLSRQNKQTKVMMKPNLGLLFKRAIDIMVALIGLVLLSPVLGLVALWIKRDSPGPVFYRGRRAARGEGEFGILKFRTMYENEHSYAGPKITSDGDPRITQLGKWLRDTKLNELPQLWNVLKGEMSLVGPRPEDPDIVAGWPADVRAEILSVRPGVTSPASVLYRNEESLLQRDTLMETYLSNITPKKQRLDQLYVRHRNFWLDLDVMMWTGFVLIPQAKRYQPPESMLFLGPLLRFVSRYLSWFIIDTIVSFFAFSASALFWRSFGPLNVGWLSAIVMAFGFALLFSTCGAFFGVQKIYWSKARSKDVLDLIPPTLVATGLVLGINQFLLGSSFFPPLMLVLAAGLSFTGYVIVRYRRLLLQSASSRWINRQSAAAMATRERLIVIGGGEAGQFAAWLLSSHQIFQVVGFVDDDLYKQGVRISGLPVLGRSQDLAELVRKHDAGMVVFAIHKIQAAERKRLLDTCAQSGAQVMLFPDFLSVLNTTIEMNHTGSPVTGPYVLSWPGIAPAQVERWLQNIEYSLENGDIEEAHKQIEILRCTLDVSKKDGENESSIHSHS